MHGTVHMFDSLPEAPSGETSIARPVAPPLRAVPLVGVIRNRRSHRNGAAAPDLSGRATLLIESPAKRIELGAILAQFARRGIDFLVIDGGDGTVRDVLTCGARVFGESWPPLILRPNGKTNALATDLGLPSEWSLSDALSAAAAGRGVMRRPLVVSQRDKPAAMVQGFVFGAGVFTPAVGLGQDAHRRGAFNSMAVGVTAAWTLLQSIFGRAGNLWRRGTEMRLRMRDGRELPHSGTGPLGERYLLFASTLRNLPAGMRPFRKVHEVLRIAMLDTSRRSLLLRMPLMLYGHLGPRAAEKGAHVLGLEELELDLSDHFILDGEAFPAGRYRMSVGPKLRFVVP